MANHLVTNVGVYALIIKDKKLLLLHKPNDSIWTALGGRMNEHEKNIEEALLREVKEEIGSDVIIGDILDVKLWSTNRKDHRLGIFYVCKLKGNGKIKLSREHDDFKFFSHEELIEMSHKEKRGKSGRELFNKLKEKRIIN